MRGDLHRPEILLSQENYLNMNRSQVGKLHDRSKQKMDPSEWCQPGVSYTCCQVWCQVEFSNRYWLSRLCQIIAK